MTNTARLIDEVSVLPIEERIVVVDSLLRTLNPIDTEIEAAWVAVAERRLDDLLSGRVQPIPAEEIFEKARKLIAR
jgi:putative addiction module component (TIGR02574 family)